jgi:hypothetical protein|tara:strand:+ start:1077 stop:1586 length:510 start_codon:yes stop_codon:yes gene_type:complete
MAHFAKLNDSNVVLSVSVVADADTTNDSNVEDEATGVAFLTDVHGWTNWKKCSRTTEAGVKYDVDSDGNFTNPSSDQSKAYRKNFPGIGWIYDSGKDAFVEPQPFSSWTLNNTTCLYDPPVAFPSVTLKGDLPYIIQWDETNTRWLSVDPDDNSTQVKWDASNSSWINI